jgi:hypothetical protein
MLDAINLSMMAEFPVFPPEVTGNADHGHRSIRGKMGENKRVRLGLMGPDKKDGCAFDYLFTSSKPRWKVVRETSVPIELSSGGSAERPPRHAMGKGIFPGPRER